MHFADCPLRAHANACMCTCADNPFRPFPRTQVVQSAAGEQQFDGRLEVLGHRHHHGRAKHPENVWGGDMGQAGGRVCVSGARRQAKRGGAREARCRPPPLERDASHPALAHCSSSQHGQARLELHRPMHAPCNPKQACARRAGRAAQRNAPCIPARKSAHRKRRGRTAGSPRFGRRPATGARCPEGCRRQGGGRLRSAAAAVAPSSGQQLALAARPSGVGCHLQAHAECLPACLPALVEGKNVCSSAYGGSTTSKQPASRPSITPYLPPTMPCQPHHTHLKARPSTLLANQCLRR